MVPTFDTETILVVDDDPGVRAIVAAVLRRLGYHVLEAENGEHALDVAAAYAAPIHLIVSDVNMPEMGGWKLLDQLRSWYPAIRFLMVSGYEQSPESLEKLAGTPTLFLAKPFMPEELSDAVRRLLDRPARRTDSSARGSSPEH